MFYWELNKIESSILYFDHIITLILGFKYYDTNFKDMQKATVSRFLLTINFTGFLWTAICDYSETVRIYKINFDNK